MCNPYICFYTTTGQTARSSRSGNTKAALVKYSIFAWTTPAIVVITSFILDKTDTVFIGYGNL